MSVKNRRDALMQVRLLEEKRKVLEIRVGELQKEIEVLEVKVGIGTDKISKAKDSDLRELENDYDVVDLYEEQIKVLDNKIKKINEKILKNNKR